ncbi:GTP 3',8-cyclase MoaA [Opitutus terrae]|uniref:GTP 3',8-cyclase n=1 Tax=Opitutus terrae (strain DSM 11246 / JCM 15787 / PB90-1) TaxID=452637 RepID=B1ZXL7_OPITP|nr:GTP 3',8-cyclase MoaA [Opitutus terrae]ACB74239.1 molybdenum cofactor biosynthesis protein A [Opitutus terrae PB90-1]
MSQLVDQFNRPLRDLRISVTDRCNFRCPYCMPKEVFGPAHAFLRDPQLMSQAEITRIVRAFQQLGVTKVRLTGGEPLLRADVPDLVRSLKQELRVPDLALTTNGWLLEKYAPSLREAGLDRVNVSVDSLQDETAGRMNGLGFKVDRVLRGIDAAAAVGLPVKINCVVQRGVNDGELLELCDYFRARGHTLRFIEFMDVGNTNHWSADRVVPAQEVVSRIAARWPLEPCGPAYRGEVASRYRYRDGGGEIGLIGSVTEPFCRDCHRARLSADGKLFTCLFASLGWDVLGCLRTGATEAELGRYLARIWFGRMDRYSDERAEVLAAGEAREKIEMSYIGG